MISRPSRPRAAAGLACLLWALAASSATAELRGLPGETVAPPGLPEIGLWMLSSGGGIADWLGGPHDGKRLLEPVNVIIIDPFASSAEDAVSRFTAAVEKAEFETREGHSGGYSALLDGETLAQFPPGSEDSFSDAPFTFSNDHGRIFGPREWRGAFYFSGAFSRESVDLPATVKHRYESFNRARDVFTQRLSARTAYRLHSFAYLGNAFPDDQSLTTGDHDGMAVVLKAIK